MKKGLKSGECFLCGYNKCNAALDLHHVDPSAKGSKISRIKNKKDRDREAAKCVVLCANCHREVHYADLIVANIAKGI